MTLTIKIDTLEQTELLSKIITDNISKGTVIILKGDLGTGKTTFSQFIGKNLGVERRMTSPTFNIIKSYDLENFTVHHMDCYRLEDSEEDLGFEEYFNHNDFALVEWPEFINEFLPEKYIEITINFEDEKRLFLIDDHGDFKHLMEALYDFAAN